MLAFIISHRIPWRAWRATVREMTISIGAGEENGDVDSRVRHRTDRGASPVTVKSP